MSIIIQADKKDSFPAINSELSQPLNPQSVINPTDLTPFPNEVLQNIFTNCTPGDLVRLSQVNTIFKVKAQRCFLTKMLENPNFENNEDQKKVLALLNKASMFREYYFKNHLLKIISNPVEARLMKKQLPPNINSILRLNFNSEIPTFKQLNELMTYIEQRDNYLFLRALHALCTLVETISLEQSDLYKFSGGVVSKEELVTWCEKNAYKLSSITSFSFENLGLFHLPEEIKYLTNLQRLFLSSNHLSILPIGIGNLTSLKELFLQNNALKNLPKEIKNLCALQIIDLRSNQFVEIPEEIYALHNLESLHLKNNKFITKPKIQSFPFLKQLSYGDQPLMEIVPALNNENALITNNSQKEPTTIQVDREKKVAQEQFMEQLKWLEKLRKEQPITIPAPVTPIPTPIQAISTNAPIVSSSPWNLKSMLITTATMVIPVATLIFVAFY